MFLEYNDYCVVNFKFCGESKMRKLQSFINKYGPIEGPVMYRRLQRISALASAHARHKKRLG